MPRHATDRRTDRHRQLFYNAPYLRRSGIIMLMKETVVIHKTDSTQRHEHHTSHDIMLYMHGQSGKHRLAYTDRLFRTRVDRSHQP